jgi:hypothetical protein
VFHFAAQLELGGQRMGDNGMHLQHLIVSRRLFVREVELNHGKPQNVDAPER